MIVMSAAHTDNIKTVAKNTATIICELWHLESLSEKFRYRNQTNILILIHFFFKNEYPNPILIGKNRKYPAGYPILILSMLNSGKC